MLPGAANMKFCHNTKFIGTYDSGELWHSLHRVPNRKHVPHKQDSLRKWQLRVVVFDVQRIDEAFIASAIGKVTARHIC
ncbi:hypothetical protein EMIT0111MI5_250003 [Burkholderia sp. IT-111MI5]